MQGGTWSATLALWVLTQVAAACVYLSLLLEMMAPPLWWRRMHVEQRASLSAQVRTAIVQYHHTRCSSTAWVVNRSVTLFEIYAVVMSFCTAAPYKDRTYPRGNGPQPQVLYSLIHSIRGAPGPLCAPRLRVLKHLRLNSTRHLLQGIIFCEIPFPNVQGSHIIPVFLCYCPRRIPYRI